MTKPFFFYEPARYTSMTVFSSPHSGAEYPSDFIASALLDQTEIRSSEDAHVDKLFGSVTDFGAPLIAARLPRAYVDLNRAADELDPALVSGAERRGANPRVSAGLGVIPRVVAEGRPIRAGKITMGEAQDRLNEGYHPYHSALERLLKSQRETFGNAVLFDCHSMPHDALSSAPLVRGRRPDIILGDRFGTSCARWVIDEVVRVFTAEGFHVARNAPFAGGFITQHYGRPSRGIHALQIEIDRGLYMNEATLALRSDFEEFSRRIRDVVGAITQLGSGSKALAAE